LCATRLLGCAPDELLENEAQERLRERAEGVRVCYVAATRARDLLIVPAVGDSPQDGWLEPLNKALYPPKSAYRAAQPCPWFTGQATVLDRPFPVLSSDHEPSIQPGAHKPQSGDYSVVWWDPAMLHLDVSEKFGLERIDVLKAEGASEQSLRDYEEWRDTRSQVIAAASIPSIEVIRIRELADEPPPAPVRLERTQNGSIRAHGLRSGHWSMPSSGMQVGTPLRRTSRVLLRCTRVSRARPRKRSVMPRRPQRVYSHTRCSGGPRHLPGATANCRSRFDYPETESSKASSIWRLWRTGAGASSSSKLMRTCTKTFLLTKSRCVGTCTR
jgi:hypothetical protein